MSELTGMQARALMFIKDRNEAGMGAIMPYAELVVAADELIDMGLSEDRGGTDRRWLTDEGMKYINGYQPTNLTGNEE